MSAPTELAMNALKRLGRYLIGRPRLVHRLDFQEASRVDCFADTDWAGCPRTRKSTSGGSLVIGTHVLKTWSSTQTSVSLSSGKAEFHGVVKAAGVALGQQSLSKDLGISLRVRVWTDSTAAIDVCKCQGLGKIRHLATHMLWVQEKVRTGSIELCKVAGEEHPADLLTKHLPSKAKLDQLGAALACEYREGRPQAAPLLRKSTSSDAQKT